MAHRSRLAVVVIDTEQSRREAGVRFWAAALDRTRLADDDPAARYAHLETPAGPTLDVIVQATSPDHAGIHLDIETDDVEAEVKRLEKLGARRKTCVEDWWVMEAPSGHAFCVIPVQTDTWPEGAIDWPDGDQPPPVAGGARQASGSEVPSHSSTPERSLNTRTKLGFMSVNI